ncbi:MAG: hypothetical protein U9P68_12305 [Pseudomonadota bacterium]|nr:hypothetical protein [Pseudomonadota bacterium]
MRWPGCMIALGAALAACEGEPGELRSGAPARFEHDYTVNCGGEPPVTWHLSLSEPMGPEAQSAFCACMSDIEPATPSPGGQLTNQAVFMRCLTDLVENSAGAPGAR